VVRIANSSALRPFYPRASFSSTLTHPAARALRRGAPLEAASAESVLHALAEENEE